MAAILPDEMVLRIFSNYSPQELAQKSRVCRDWRRIASDKTLWDKFDITKVFSQKVCVIDEKIWSKHCDVKTLGLSFRDVYALDHRVAIPELGRFFFQLKQEQVRIEGDAGVTILTIPNRLTLLMLQTIAQNNQGPRTQGPRTTFQGLNFGYSFFRGARDSQAYRILMTNGLLRGEGDLLEKAQCRKPGVLEAGSLAIMTFKSTQPPFRIFGNQDPLPRSYTLCQECLPDLVGCDIIEDTNRFLLVGGFSDQGLFVESKEDSNPLHSTTIGVRPFDGTWKEEEKN